MSTIPTPPEAAECEWPIDTGCVDLDMFDTASVERARMLATSALRSLTLFRVGGCPRTIRPCAESCTYSAGGDYSGGSLVPYVYNGQWFNNGCLCGPTGCGCSALSEVVLPPPVGNIVEVRVDGEVLDPSAYRVDEGKRLTRVDGDVWPTCQNLALEDTKPGTFSVTYLPGYPVDALGALAGGLLTAEFAKACTGKGKCRLPSGVTQISRQGVTMTIGADAFPGQRTGIREVDVFIQRWNPHGLRTAPRVLTPDIHRGRVTP